MSKNHPTYKQIVIGVDQSYKNTGISIVTDGVLRDVKSIRLEKYKANSKKRYVIRSHIKKLLELSTERALSVICIVERARIHGGPNSFINIDAIKAIGALTATVVDVCAIYDVPVFSVDTRCWKSQVIGTSKGSPNKYGVPQEKWPTIKWCIGLGFEDKILVPVSSRKTKGTFVRNGQKYQYNDDAADSAGIAMFYIVGDRNKLKEEK